MQKAKSFIEFQDEDKRDDYLAVANTQPSRLLLGDKPRLFDEWQDAVLHLGDGRYAIIEIKLGSNEINDGAEHLNEIERLIKQHNVNEPQVPLRLPDLKIILTGTEFGYKREDEFRLLA